MTPPRSPVGPSECHIAGQAEADRVLDLVQGGVAHPDQVYMALMEIWGKYGNPGLLGATRRLQKALERQAT